MTLRKFGSKLEGHPTMAFPFTEVATGSLGQGLSVGVGMALNAKYIDKLSYKTYVLLGDSEMAEGSCFEAMQVAAHYKLNNLVVILDVNRLGQRGETMYGWNVEDYQKRIEAFGWETITVDGHSIPKIILAYKKAIKSKKPFMIIAKTIKGKGVSIMENKEGWHGKVLSKEELQVALKELGNVDKPLIGEIHPVKSAAQSAAVSNKVGQFDRVNYSKDKPIATRKAYGNALVRIFPKFNNMVVLDAEVSNSTFAETFKKVYPDHFFEMYIAEQNMVGTAVGFSKRNKIPFVSTFSAFFTRAFDQIRMAEYSNANIKFVGSHAGVSIGEDGVSQMGLEDIAMFRTLLNGVVLYPSDAISTEKLVEKSAEYNGIVYIRTTRQDTPIIYSNNEEFLIGGSKTIKSNDRDVATIVAAGITVHEAVKAYEQLAKENIFVRIIDLYSIKPLDVDTLKKAVHETKNIIVVEDHYAEGGIGEAVIGSLKNETDKIYHLAVRKMPKSGKPAELLDYEEISADAIIKKVKELIK